MLAGSFNAADYDVRVLGRADAGTVPAPGRGVREDGTTDTRSTGAAAGASPETALPESLRAFAEANRADAADADAAPAAEAAGSDADKVHA